MFRKCQRHIDALQNEDDLYEILTVERNQYGIFTNIHHGMQKPFDCDVFSVIFWFECATNIHVIHNIICL